MRGARARTPRVLTSAHLISSRCLFAHRLAGSWIDRMITKLLHAPLLEQIETAMSEWEATQVCARGLGAVGEGECDVRALAAQGALATYAAERERLAQYTRMAKELLQQLDIYKQCAENITKPRVSLAGFEKIRRRHSRLLVGAQVCVCVCVCVCVRG